MDPCPIWLGDLGALDGRQWCGRVDILTAGFPCQPWSAAGSQRGHADERWLWPDLARLIAESASSQMTNDLFNVGRRKKRVKAPVDPVVAQAMTRIMLRVYKPLYALRFHEEPHVEPRDWAALKRLILEHGPRLVEERVALYVAWDDAWVVERGLSLCLLPGQWNRLAAQLHQHRQRHNAFKCDHVPPCPSETEHTTKTLQDRRTRPTSSTNHDPSKRSGPCSDPF